MFRVMNGLSLIESLEVTCENYSYFYLLHHHCIPGVKDPDVPISPMVVQAMALPLQLFELSPQACNHNEEVDVMECNQNAEGDTEPDQAGPFLNVAGVEDPRVVAPGAVVVGILVDAIGKAVER